MKSQELKDKLDKIIEEKIGKKLPQYIGYDNPIKAEVVNRILDIIESLMVKKECYKMEFVKEFLKVLDGSARPRRTASIVKNSLNCREFIKENSDLLVKLIYYHDDEADTYHIIINEMIATEVFRVLNKLSNIDACVESLGSLLLEINRCRFYANKFAGWGEVEPDQDGFKAIIGEKIIELFKKHKSKQAVKYLLKTIEGSYTKLENKAIDALGVFKSEEVKEYLLLVSWGAIKQYYEWQINAEHWDGYTTEPSEKQKKIARKAMKKLGYKYNEDYLLKTIVKLFDKEDIYYPENMVIPGAIAESYRKGSLTKEVINKISRILIKKWNNGSRDGNRILEALFFLLQWTEDIWFYPYQKKIAEILEKNKYEYLWDDIEGYEEIYEKEVKKKKKKFNLF